MQFTLMFGLGPEKDLLEFLAPEVLLHILIVLFQIHEYTHSLEERQEGSCYYPLWGIWITVDLCSGPLFCGGRDKYRMPHGCWDSSTFLSV